MRVVKTRGDELRAEAEANRLAACGRAPEEIRLAVSGRHLHFGSLVIIFGRTLCEEDARHHQGARA